MATKTTNAGYAIVGGSPHPVVKSLLQFNSFFLEKLQNFQNGGSVQSMPSNLPTISKNKLPKEMKTTICREQKSRKGSRSKMISKEHDLKYLSDLVQSIESLTKLRRGASTTQSELDRLKQFLENQLIKSNKLANDSQEEKETETNPS